MVILPSTVKYNSNIPEEGYYMHEFSTDAYLVKEHYFDGLLHKEDGPAKIVKNKKDIEVIVEYFMFGRHHRKDGPAYMIFENGNYCREWIQNDEKHRLDGPAIINFYRENINSFDENCSINIDNYFSTDEKIYIEEEYYVGGCLHRQDGPAIVKKIKENDNVKIESFYYYINGCLHRLDGPAIKNDTEELWYCNGLLHRMNGPAVVRKNRKEYWIDGLYIPMDDCVNAE